MTLESIINFENGQRVMLNPDNSGFTHINAYGKVANRMGTIRNIPIMGYINEHGDPTARRCRKLSVLWDGDKSTRQVDYKHLMILSK